MLDGPCIDGNGLTDATRASHLIELPGGFRYPTYDGYRRL
jgi:hypothetical protein